MLAEGIPTYQTKSKKNLFADDSNVLATSFECEDVIFSNDPRKNNDNAIEIKSVPSHSKNSDSPNKSPGRKKSKSPKKRSPFKSPKSKSPSKSDDMGSPGFFSRMFCAFTGYNSGGTYRAAPVAKGVYFDIRASDVPRDSVKTMDTQQESDDENAAFDGDWIASNLEGHQQGVPGLVRRTEYDEYDEIDDQKLLKKIMAKAKKLPQEPGKYASNHIMVNAVRTKRNIPPLRRERHMDQVAREQAKLMAEENTLFHIESPNELISRLREKDKESNELPNFERLGTNIGKGKDIAEAHRFMVAALAERNNIHDKRFFSMGMGAHTADNGVIYVCQIFGG